MAESVQNTYRRNVNPFVAGQVATGRDCQFDSGRLVVNGTYTRPTIPFGYAVGWVNNPTAEVGGSSILGGNACALHFTTSGSGATLAVTNFYGVAHRNVALPGAGTPIQGAPNVDRVLDAYNQNDIVSIGSEGDFVVVCDGAVTRGSKVTLNLSTASNTTGNYGQFSDTTAGTSGSGNDAAIHGALDGAIFMTDSRAVTPYSGGDEQILAVVRIRLQPR